MPCKDKRHEEEEKKSKTKKEDRDKDKKNNLEHRPAAIHDAAYGARC